MHVKKIMFKKSRYQQARKLSFKYSAYGAVGKLRNALQCSPSNVRCFLIFLLQSNPQDSLTLIHPVHPPLPTWGRCSNAQVPEISQMLRCGSTGLPDACKPTDPSLPLEFWTSTWFTVCGSRAPHSTHESIGLPQKPHRLPGAGQFSGSDWWHPKFCVYLLFN